MSTIKVGDILRVKVQFVDFDPVAGTDEFIDPFGSVTGKLYKYGTDVATPGFVFQSFFTSSIVEENLYTFYYDWTTPEDGKFMLRFDADIGSAIHIIHDRVFYIGTAEPTITLGTDLEYCFITALDPLYLDPEEVRAYYDIPGDACYMSQVTEIIYRLSLQLEAWFGEDLVITPLMHDWLLASTMCELSRIYFYDGGIGGFSSGDSFMLGDLQVSKNKGSGSNSRDDLYRGNATTWCELAALFRDELLWRVTNMKGVVRNGARPNPIPPRYLKNYEKGGAGQSYRGWFISDYDRWGINR